MTLNPALSPGQVRLVVSRDDVAAGDDNFGTELVLPAGTTLDRVYRRLIASYRLASIMGGKATWVLNSLPASGTFLPRQFVPVAVLAQQWDSPTWVVDATAPVRDLAASRGDEGLLRLHFSYEAQADPHEVARRMVLKSS